MQGGNAVPRRAGETAVDPVEPDRRPQIPSGSLPAKSQGRVMVPRGLPLLQGRKALLERRALGSQPFNLPGLFLSFVKQHRYQLQVPYRLNLAVKTVTHQTWVYLRPLLRHQAVLHRVGGIAIVVE